MDDDVVVILDGFDVLLLPSIGNILHVSCFPNTKKRLALDPFIP